MKQTAPGIRTLALPLPFELSHVNVHLVELDEGYLLVDAGLGTDACFTALEAGLAEAGVSWREIRTLLLTHLHPDHVGLTTRIRELSGARLLMHGIDAANLAKAAAQDHPGHFHEAMQLAGVPQELKTRIQARLKDARRGFAAHTPDWELEGGERLNVKGGTLEVVWTPGHSSGHVCLFSPEHRFLISGDHLLEKISPNVGWRPQHDMLGQYLDSLALVGDMDVEWVLPSHGEPFQQHRQRTDEIRNHHDERCREIMGHIRTASLTAHELVSPLWPRKLSSFHHHFAVLEVLAHLEYLRRRGPVSAEARADGSLEWRHA